MSMWESKEDEDDREPKMTTPANWDGESLDDYSWNDEDEYPELREYREVLINSPAYAWLASTLNAELQHETLGEDRRAKIHQTIINMLGTRKHTISRREAPPTVLMRFHTSWNMMSFFRYQEYDIPLWEALPRAVVLTGHGNNIQSSTVEEYISQVWPYYGPEILKLYQWMGTEKGPKHCEYLSCLICHSNFAPHESPFSPLLLDIIHFLAYVAVLMPEILSLHALTEEHEQVLWRTIRG